MRQAVSENLELIQPLNGSTPFSYATDDPLETVLDENYFLPVRGNLRRGDTIRVFRNADRHLQIWDLVVLESGHRCVAVDLIATIYDGTKAAKAPSSPKKKAK